MHTHNRKAQRETETQRGKKRGIRNERETELERQRQERNILEMMKERFSFAKPRLPFPGRISERYLKQNLI